MTPGDWRRQLGNPRRRGDERRARWVGAWRRHGPAEPGASGCPSEAASRGRRPPDLHQGASSVASGRPGMLSSFDFVFSCSSLWGCASAPTGCSPRVSGRLLSRWPGTPSGEFPIFILSHCLSQEYHNLRVIAFNRNVEQLGKQTADLSESRSESSFILRGGALAHPRAVVPEIRADC